MDYTANDKIGRQEIVDKICSLVDGLQPTKHFCLALNGEWGSGKTYVMQMIEEQFANRGDICLVKYDAWKNNFYSDPLIAILYSMWDSLKQYNVGKTVSEEIKKQVNSLVKQKAQQCFNSAINELKKSGGKTAVFAFAIEAIKSIIVKTKNNLMPNNQQLQDFESYQMLLDDTKSLLNGITATQFDSDKQTKLVILVDEIDRCLPDEQLKILERLHHLFDINNCAVICAVNKKAIEQGFKTMYGFDDNKYLRKFFDFNYDLPMCGDLYLKSLLSDFFAKIKSVLNKADNDSLTQAYNCIVYGKTKVLLPLDNRQIERFVRTLNLICNDFGWENLGSPQVFFIVVATLIRGFVDPKFLDRDYVATIESKYEQTKNENGKMPFYDFFKHYVGVDRIQDICTDNAIEEIGRSAVGFIWQFNEITCVACDCLVYYYGYYNKQVLPTDTCHKLRELIIKYGENI